MQRWYYIVLGGILIAGGAYIYMHRNDLGLSSPSATPVDVSSDQSSSQSSSQYIPARIVWTTIDRTPQGFKLEMPADSKEIQIPAYNQTGGADQVDMIYAYPDAETSFSISWADNPPVERVSGGSVEKTLDAARDDALSRTQSTLAGETKSIRQGYPVRDFVGRNDGGGVFNARLILAGRRLYMLIAAFPSASARRPEDVNRFFDSFHLLSPANGS